MDYEKKYKEALARAKDIIHHYKNPEYSEILPYAESDLSTLFPELKESEDERIRNRIELCLEECIHSDIIRDCDKDEVLAWLEKQGKKKVCSGEANDEALEKQLQIWFEKGKSQGKDEVIYHPENFGLQKLVEWSKVDEEHRLWLISIVKEVRKIHPTKWHEREYKGGIDWLESLRPQSHWKPGKEQIEALRYAASKDGVNHFILTLLIADLEKLIE